MDFGANLWAYDKIGKVAGDLPKLPESPDRKSVV